MIVYHRIQPEPVGLRSGEPDFDRLVDVSPATTVGGDAAWRMREADTD